MSPEILFKKGSKTTTNRKQRFFHEIHNQPIFEDGLENAPDESGFISGTGDDMLEYQQRIVNESSLYNDYNDEEDEPY